MKGSSRSAFTIVELAVTMVLTIVVFGGLAQAVSSAQSSYRDGVAYMRIEAEGTRTMAKIVERFRAADLDSLSPVAAPPFSSSFLNYQWNESFDGTQTIWSDPERIFLDGAAGSVVCAERPGLPDESTTIWSRQVAALLEGELLDGADTNGNGLLDEAGLCFTREGDLLSIRMTLQATDGRGQPVSRSWTAQIHCRN